MKMEIGNKLERILDRIMTVMSGPKQTLVIHDIQVEKPRQLEYHLYHHPVSYSGLALFEAQGKTIEVCEGSIITLEVRNLDLKKEYVTRYATYPKERRLNLENIEYMVVQTNDNSRVALISLENIKRLEAIKGEEIVMRMKEELPAYFAERVAAKYRTNSLVR